MHFKYGDNMISIVNKKHNANKYAGNGWNLEYTTKYVVDINNKLVEVGYFLHFLEKKNTTEFVKEVIELPSSRGCPIKCSYCASSYIDDYNPLTSDEIVELFNYTYNSGRKQNQYLLVTMTGIGDYTLCHDNINKALLRINQGNSSVHFTVSSCIWNKESIEAVSKLDNSVDIRSVNITYLSDDSSIVKKLIRYYDIHSYDANRLVKEFNSTSLHNLRVNYLMIKDVNDDLDSYKTFVKTFEPLKRRLKVRISKMNKTIASTKAGLCSPKLQDMMSLKEYLESNGFTAYLFYSDKDDHMNCGQLLTEETF